MASAFVDVLTEMGFERNRAEKALEETGNAGVEVAMEWLITHENDAIYDEVTDETTKTAEDISAATATAATTSSTEQSAKSLKCEDCGKIFAGIGEAELHATRTGHSNFTESTESIKPLTEEEKQQQLVKVQELLKQRRVEREEKERVEQLEREKSRRNMGKEISQAKQKMQEMEMKKILDQRKRDKEEERAAKQRVKEQIEKDKRDRDLKFGKTNAVNEPQQQQQLQTATTSQQQQRLPQLTKEYIETKIQIRLLNGDKLVETFKVDESLAAVRLFVQQKSAASAAANSASTAFSGLGPFTFSTNFPRKDYNDDEMQMSLKESGSICCAHA
ncbi:hypothetical protein HELRODRAFT_186190 [Helobdella robusta]|uniref:UBX domain-containing protein n=1 Tax=Helobdella robusta TaxID=6412 RepID=T1FNS6_HELRO|nr:hypothetical protein HELRODRAFT_186190 [Helobdella robusta]ESN91167.1 hypothetical protein HELRODRAFT_186190 [Helobdella robusta]